MSAPNDKPSDKPSNDHVNDTKKADQDAKKEAQPNLNQPVVIKNKVLLVSIDGWGISDNPKGNAIFHAKIPVMTELQKKYPHGQLDASGLAVGLPEGIMGNSEVGHLTMGAGRIDFQDLVRINRSLKDNSFFTNPTLVTALNEAKNGTGRIHLLGLVSDGSVHSHIDHLFALLSAAKRHPIPNAFIHFFADGRDTPPKSSIEYLEKLIQYLKSSNYGSLSTIMGRYYAMDRDKRYERVKVAYDAITNKHGLVLTVKESKEGSQHYDNVFEAAKEAITAKFNNNETDEFLQPIIVDKNGSVLDGDVMIFFDFRADRMRQIVEAFGVKQNFTPEVIRKNLHLVQMTQYNADFKFPILFPPQNMSNVLAEWISKHGLTQFHSAETEKYAHVTFFFNGGKELAFPKEDRKLVDSPKVATYDLKPEMSMTEVANTIAAALAKSPPYPFVMCNLAGPDMVGHTGKYDKTLVAVEVCDKAIGIMWEACQKHGYAMVITADHGNAEEMVDADGKEKTAHTTNPVPLLICGAGDKFVLSRSKGGLCDVAPTVLTLMGLSVPPEMTGTSMVRSVD